MTSMPTNQAGGDRLVLKMVQGGQIFTYPHRAPTCAQAKKIPNLGLEPKIRDFLKGTRSLITFGLGAPWTSR